MSPTLPRHTHHSCNSIHTAIHPSRLPTGVQLPKTVKSLLLLLTATGLSLSLTAPSYSVLPPEVLMAQQPSNVNQPTQILYVSPSVGNDQGQGSQQSPLRTLTRALQLATPHTAIVLAPGTYSEQTGEQFPLMLRPNITLQGNPDTKGQEVVIYGGGFYTSRTSAKQNITILGANGARLSGLTITNPYDRGYGLWIESTSLIASQNTFTDNTHDGISIVGMSAPLIQNNVFRDNGANGITIYGSSRPEIRENEFQNTGFGINVAQQAAPFIVGNRIIYNKDGVVIQGNARPVLRENYIEQNQRDGIVAIASGIVDLGNPQEPGRNTIQNNGRYDVHNGTDGQRMVAYGNQLSQQRIAGTVDRGSNLASPSGLTQQLTTAAIPTTESNPSRRSPVNVTADLPVYIPDPNTVSVPEPEITESVAPQTPVAIEIPVPPPEANTVALEALPNPTVPQYNSIRPTVQPIASPKPEPNNESANILAQLRSQAANAINIPVPLPESNQSARVIYPLSTQPAVTPTLTRSSSVLPVPGRHIPVSNQGHLPTGLEPRSTASSLTPIATSLLGLQYRVVVEDISETTYQQVRRFVPEAFRTVVKNRSVIQVGAFRDRGEANQIWQQLTQNRIPAKIEPFN